MNKRVLLLLAIVLVILCTMTSVSGLGVSYLNSCNRYGSHLDQTGTDVESNLLSAFFDVLIDMPSRIRNGSDHSPLNSGSLNGFIMDVNLALASVQNYHKYMNPVLTAFSGHLKSYNPCGILLRI